MFVQCAKNFCCATLHLSFHSRQANYSFGLLCSDLTHTSLDVSTVGVIPVPKTVMKTDLTLDFFTA